MIDIKLINLTNGSIVTDPDTNMRIWQGTGIFDKLITAVSKNLEIQYLNRRITGEDYAQVYSTALTNVLQQSMSYIMQEQLIEEQIKLAYTQRIKADKEAALLGLDDVIRESNLVPQPVYKPKYESTTVSE